MRQRNKPWAQEVIDAHPNKIIPNPSEVKGKWNRIFNNDKPIHLEIGTGKGRFIAGMSKQNPDANFIGMEKAKSIIVSALDLIKEHENSNVVLLNEDATFITDYFDQGELSVIYLNFSDPWPKNRHEKRRLSYKTFLDRYKTVLAANGEIHMKTDNQGLFEYSLESFSRYGMVVKNISLDLHNSDFTENIMTEYEEKFSNKGSRIYRCEAYFKR